jgi:hypothetical protein
MMSDITADSMFHAPLTHALRGADGGAASVVVLTHFCAAGDGAMTGVFYPFFIRALRSRTGSVLYEREQAGGRRAWRPRLVVFLAFPVFHT